MNNVWSKQKQNSRRKLAFCQCFWIVIAVPENHRTLRNLVWKFSKVKKDLPAFDIRAVSGHVLGNHIFHQSKQTQPPSRSLPGINKNEYRGVHRQKHQVLFNQAPEPQIFRTSACKKTSNFYHSPVYMVYFQVNLCQLLYQFSFQVNLKLWLNGENVLQAVFYLNCCLK